MVLTGRLKPKIRPHREIGVGSLESVGCSWLMFWIEEGIDSRI